ncbi:MAG: asparagine synthase [Candidatus Saccharibacteria bacterium]|nr:asparagine synthase [Candidatus Saccharibacteria bacterium]
MTLTRQSAFFEAALTTRHHDLTGHGAWSDKSTQDYFIFVSSFGTVKLRKRHAYPATFARSIGPSLIFGYGNETLGHMIAEQALSNVSEDAFVSEEFLYCTIDCQQQSIVVQRDAVCTMPLFTMEHSDVIALSNRYDQLFNQIDKRQVHINQAALVNYLLFDDRHNQLATGADVLYDRVRFILRDGATHVTYPNHAYIAEKTQEKGHPRFFKEALETTLDTYWERYDTIGFQLSGGLDSATAPGYFASQGKTVVAASFGLPATMGERQRAKLDDMARRFSSLQNHIINLTPEEYFPFSDRITANHWGISHEYQDIHQLAAMQMADYFSRQGITAMFTGVGGDELCQNITNDKIFPFGSAVKEARATAVVPQYMTDKFKILHTKTQEQTPHHQDRPIPTVAYSVILTNIGFNNTFIDRNVWPVAPLSDPKLFLYAQSIPAWYRHDKGLLRAYQFARQFPPSIVYPETLEDFSEFLHFCKPQVCSLLDSFFDVSLLGQHDLIDESSFKDYYTHATRSKYDDSDTRILELIRLLAVEINLRMFQ